METKFIETYLLQGRISQLQYVEKSETPFNICLNKYRKDGNYKPQF